MFDIMQKTYCIILSHVEFKFFFQQEEQQYGRPGSSGQA